MSHWDSNEWSVHIKHHERYKNLYDEFFGRSPDQSHHETKNEILRLLREANSNVGCIKPEETKPTENLLLLLEDVC